MIDINREQRQRLLIERIYKEFPIQEGINQLNKIINETKVKETIWYAKIYKALLLTCDEQYKSATDIVSTLENSKKIKSSKKIVIDLEQAIKNEKYLPNYCPPSFSLLYTNKFLVKKSLSYIGSVVIFLTIAFISAVGESWLMGFFSAYLSFFFSVLCLNSLIDLKNYREPAVMMDSKGIAFKSLSFKDGYVPWDKVEGFAFEIHGQDSKDELLVYIDGLQDLLVDTNWISKMMRNFDRKIFRDVAVCLPLENKKNIKAIYDGMIIHYNFYMIDMRRQNTNIINDDQDLEYEYNLSDTL